MTRHRYIQPRTVLIGTVTGEMLLAGSDNFKVGETTGMGLYGDEEQDIGNAMSRRSSIWDEE